jgi:hypothetical protein
MGGLSKNVSVFALPLLVTTVSPQKPGREKSPIFFPDFGSDGPTGVSLMF